MLKPYDPQMYKPYDQNHHMVLPSPFSILHSTACPRQWLLSSSWKKTQGIKLQLTHNLDSILKSREVTLPTKVHLIKAMVFTVVMYGYESWTIKKAGHQRSDAFELWC